MSTHDEPIVVAEVAGPSGSFIRVRKGAKGGFSYRYKDTESQLSGCGGWFETPEAALLNMREALDPQCWAFQASIEMGRELRK